jgi:hypothetical protein
MIAYTITYSGIERKPVPEHPTKEQALYAIGMLSSGSLRNEAREYYSKIAKNYIESSQYKDDI